MVYKGEPIYHSVKSKSRPKELDPQDYGFQIFMFDLDISPSYL